MRLGGLGLESGMSKGSMGNRALTITYTILGFLIIMIVSCAPNPYSNDSCPYINIRWG